MDDIAKDRGASGHGSILFRQNLEYPREPGQITYYPPEPSEGLKKQAVRDKAGGITLYILGFLIGLIALMVAMNFSNDLEIYYLLIPLLLVLGLVFAILFLILKNVTLAKLSRTLPRILMVALILLYALSSFQNVNDLMGIEGPGDEPQHPGEFATAAENQTYQQEMVIYEQEREAAEQEMENAFDNLKSGVVNPGFFLLIVGLVVAGAGGTMLWTSTKVVEQYVPGTIILEVPSYTPPPDEYEEEFYDEEEAEPGMAPAQESPPQEQSLCADCDGPLTYIKQYDRWYCYECQEYAPKES